jgi:hypothetical protein
VEGLFRACVLECGSILPLLVVSCDVPISV